MTASRRTRAWRPSGTTRWIVECLLDDPTREWSGLELAQEQTRQAVSVLLPVQQLAWALGDPSPDVEPRPRRRSLRCTLHLHHYALHPEDGIDYGFEGTRCHKDRWCAAEPHRWWAGTVG